MTSEIVNLWLPNEQKTRIAGGSLAYTLYGFPLTIFLQGDLGAGKTTFLQGFAEELGIPGPLTSPTYALEQRYETKDSVPFIHIDLYRLSPADAARVLEQTDAHEGIRCVEWADRLDDIPKGMPHIFVRLEEKGAGRQLDITFGDTDLPSVEDIERWRNEVCLPANVRAHCDTVAAVAEKLCDSLLERGTVVRKEATVRAAALHDLLRFLDFSHGGEPTGKKARTAEEESAWEGIRARYPGMKHEAAIAAFLDERGFRTIAAIVRTHGLNYAHTEKSTVEELVVYYADKRVAHDKCVTLQERFDDLLARYGKEFGELYDSTKRVESMLFPDGPPF